MLDLVEALRRRGTARLPVEGDRTVRVCRADLIEAAKKANVRIAMKRVVEHDPPFEQVVATVLSPEQAERQQERDVVFRAVNRIRNGIDILQTVDTSAISDEVLDLKDIADELEDYAREISGGATGATLLSPSDAAPALVRESK